MNTIYHKEYIDTDDIDTYSLSKRTNIQFDNLIEMLELIKKEFESVDWYFIYSYSVNELEYDPVKNMFITYNNGDKYYCEIQYIVNITLKDYRGGIYVNKYDLIYENIKKQYIDTWDISNMKKKIQKDHTGWWSIK